MNEIKQSIWEKLQGELMEYPPRNDEFSSLEPDYLCFSQLPTLLAKYELHVFLCLYTFPSAALLSVALLAARTGLVHFPIL